MANELISNETNYNIGYVDAITMEMDKLQTLVKISISPNEYKTEIDCEFFFIKRNDNVFTAMLTENGGPCTKEEIDKILSISRR